MHLFQLMLHLIRLNFCDFKKITGHHSIDKRFLIGEVMYNVVTFDYLNK